jgi:U4/U6 small nuclear ribonucleoprotein PRP4
MDIEGEDTDDSDSDEEVRKAVALQKILTFRNNLQKEDEFYTPGSDDLLKARRKIAEFSLARCVTTGRIQPWSKPIPSLSRARRRIAKQREEAAIPLSRIVEVRKKLYGDLKVSLLMAVIQRWLANVDNPQNYTQLGSQIGDERPISQVRYSPNSKLLLTGSWTGNARVWDMPNCSLKSTMRGMYYSFAIEIQI